jgi:hypothetical protein
MKLMESAKKNIKSKNHETAWPRYVMCLDNKGWAASLEIGKCYRQIKPHKNDMKGWLRIIDESGEDYLFPARNFVEVELPPKARRAIAALVH